MRARFPLFLKIVTWFLLNLAGVIITTLVTYFWGTLVFKIDMSSFPEWATIVNGGG